MGKKLLLFLILFGVIIFIYSEDTVPQILIEGSEIENITINETNGNKIKLTEPTLKHKKVLLKGENKKNSIKKQTYQFLLGLGNHIYTLFNANFNLNIKNISVLPYFSYYHNNPFNSHYIERFNGNVQWDYRMKSVKIDSNISNTYSIFQYLSKDFFNKNYFYSQIKLKYFLNSDITLSYLSYYGLKFFYTNNNFYRTEIFSNQLNGNVYLNSIKLNFNFILDVGKKKNPHYIVSMKAVRPFNNGNIIVGLASYKFSKSSLFPIFHSEYKIGSLLFFLDSQLIREKINLYPILFLYDNGKFLYQLNKKLELGLKLLNKVAVIQTFISYNDIENSLEYEKKNDFIVYNYNKNYPAFLGFTLSHLGSFNIYLTYKYNLNKRENIARNTFLLTMDKRFWKLLVKLKLNYYDLVFIKNGILPAYIDFDLSLFYKISKVFSMGISTQRIGYNIFYKPQTNVIAFIRILL